MFLQAVRHGVRNISNVAETAATLGFAPKHKQCQIHLQVRVVSCMHQFAKEVTLAQRQQLLLPCTPELFINM